MMESFMFIFCFAYKIKWNNKKIYSNYLEKAVFFYIIMDEIDKNVVVSCHFVYSLKFFCALSGKIYQNKFNCDQICYKKIIIETITNFCLPLSGSPE